MQEGIPYDPKAVPISKSSKDELIELQKRLKSDYVTAKEEDRAIIDLANGVIDLRLKNVDEAISSFSNHLEESPPREKFLLLYKLGDAYIAKKDKEKAKETWLKALNTDISSPLIPILLTKLARLEYSDNPALSATYLTSALNIGLEDQDAQEEVEKFLSNSLTDSKDDEALGWRTSNLIWYSGQSKPTQRLSELDVLTRGTGFFKSKHYRNAIRDYQILVKRKVSYERYLLQQIYDSAKKLKDLKLQNDVLTKLTGEPTEPKQETTDARINLARFKWNNDQNNIARKILKDVIKKDSNPKAKVMLAKIDAEARDYSSALFQLDSVVREHPNSEEAEPALFWSAWYLYLEHRYAEARTQFEKFRKRYGKVADFYQASYFWEAMSAKSLGDNVTANKLLLSLAADRPFSYYGLLSQRELGKLPLKTPEPVPQMAFNRTLFTNASETYLDWLKFSERLIAVGLDKLGLYYLEAAIRKGGDKDDLHWRLRLYSAQLYIQANKQLAGIRQIYKLRNENQKLPNWYIWLLYPRPYWKEILKAAEEFNLDPYMIISIMRQESAFNPKALSPADAYGLMQLLPATAKNIARQTGLPVPTTRQLFDPEINIRLGAANIKSLLKRFKNRWVLALSSYNASPRVAAKWLDTRWRPESLEFIEEIPYTETRTYVKLIIRNYLTYRALYQPEGDYPEGLFSH